ncbi:TonB-dependent receptor [Niveispirillum sp. KHB5.9]|uniref:TonB-dependent receptor n=1 Tax=Niveispirillum sp. KHB5.9 TaxID=3400269 RepID=UPI003A8AA992
MFRVGIDSAVRAAAGTPAFDTAASAYKIESYAFFGQATLHVTDQFDVTLGGRYSKDKKRARQTGATMDALPIIAAPFDVTNRAEYSSFDPRIVATYKFTLDVNVYASYSTGFKSGGFQYVPFNAASANTLFDPEDIKTYEVGLKSEWLDRKLRLNAAGFYYDYRNLQVSRIIDTPSGPQTLISNAATSTVKGIEVELLMRVARDVELSATYGYLDATYDKYVFNLGQNLVFDGTALVRAPKNTLNLGGEWRIPVADDTLTLRADYALLSTFYHEPGEGDPIFGSGIPLTRKDGYGLLDLRATYQMGAFRINAYGTNVTNKKYRRTVNALGNTIIGFAGQPAIYGVKLGYSF